MSDPVSALQGAYYEGAVTVTEAGPRGMISLRGDLSSDTFASSVKRLTHLDIPSVRKIVQTDATSLAWMSPDELLVMLPHTDARAMTADLGAALAGTHHMAVDVSDARALFRLEGGDAALRETLAKLAPVDLHPDRFGPGDFRRTRLAQVPAAIAMPAEGTVELICFRSVAQYVMDILRLSASASGRVGYFD
ncbi:sarcosine oxidase subunit gamma [Brevirhabdus sp.]|uniref:sarcosine oxidase subunit gamma n=1 Tax=Brevirhabdus sp. TaxID=2004514 RepID=UPI0040599CD9